jgi:hypothetical protein
MSGRSPAPLRHATKKVRMISELLIMVQDSIYRQPGLTAEAATHLPKLDRPGRWVEHSYEPTDDMELLENTARGRLLFKYDANHSPQTPRNLANLWSETTELHRDAW